MSPPDRKATSTISSPRIESQSQFSPLAIDLNFKRHGQEESNIKGSSLIKRETDDTVTVARYSYPFKHAIDLEQTRRHVHTCDLCGAFIHQEETWFCNRCNCDICDSCYNRLT
jgi:hypothetical protein